MFVVDERQFKDLLYTPEVRYAEVNINGDVRRAIVQETQFHPEYSSTVLHPHPLFMSFIKACI